MEKIRINNLSKSFDNNKILDNVSLVVEEGDIYGILGLSGAGKSTLIRCINGLEAYDEGEILFNGELLSSSNLKVKREHQRKIGMIFQSFNLLQQLSVLQNVEFALKICNVKDKTKRRELALEALRKVGLEEKANAYPSQLSGGQAQRVAIARTLVLNPEVLLCDEATSALDPETTSSILELLKKLNKELGLTIIMISHQINVIEEICNKVAILSNSKIIENGEMSDVFLSPKTEITKSLVYSNHIKTLLDDRKMLRIKFNGNLDEPLIANIVNQCGILVSIVYADTKVIDDKVYGQVLIKLPQKKTDIKKLEKYLEIKKIDFEEVI